MDEIEKTPTIPDIPSIRVIKLSHDQLLIYIVVRNSSGIVLGIAISLALAACVIASAALFLVYQLIK